MKDGYNEAAATNGRQKAASRDTAVLRASATARSHSQP
jgi:hypothetical protein